MDVLVIILWPLFYITGIHPNQNPWDFLSHYSALRLSLFLFIAIHIRQTSTVHPSAGAYEAFHISADPALAVHSLPPPLSPSHCLTPCTFPPLRQ